MYYLLNRYLPIKALLLFTAETLLLVTVILASVLFAELEMKQLLSDWSMQLTLFLTLLYLCLFYCLDLYSPDSYKPGTKMLAGVLYSFSLSGIGFFLLTKFYPTANKWDFALPVILPPVIVLLWRTSVSLFGKRTSGERVLIIGSGELASKISSEIESQQFHDIKIAGFIGVEAGSPVCVPSGRLVGGMEDIQRVVKEQHVCWIITALDDRRKKLSMQKLLQLKIKGVTVEEGQTFNERLTGRILLEGIKPSWMVFSEGFRYSRSKMAVKRVFDILMACLVLTISFPVIIVTAVLIKLDSKGPVIFSQERVGENGKIFKIFKFRSMRCDAEKNTGPVWASVDDSRVTRIGKVIRKLRIDELPQLINVFRGDISFVGPRPERPYFNEMLKKAIPYYELRTLVKPGLTGWAQIKYPYGATEQDALEKLQYDLYYIKNFSLILDLLITFWTVRVVFTGKGAR